MTEEMATTEQTMDSGAELMTPEELALLKKLQAKRKQQQKALSGAKESLFDNLTEQFIEQMKKQKKDLITISTGKEPYSDGNLYAITFGTDTSEDGDEQTDSKELAVSILDSHINTIDMLMGISNSIKVTGDFQGQKAYWQIRKRDK